MTEHERKVDLGIADGILANGDANPLRRSWIPPLMPFIQGVSVMDILWPGTQYRGGNTCCSNIRPFSI